MLAKLLNQLSFRYNYLFPLYARLPYSLAYRLTHWQAKYVAQHKHQQAEIIYEQMQNHLVDYSEAMLQQEVQRYFCMVEDEILDSFSLHKSPDLVTLVGFDQVLAARKAERKVILTSGHFGRYWFSGPAMYALGQKISTITRDGDENNPYQLDQIENTYRIHKLNRLQKALGGAFLLEGQANTALYNTLDEHLLTLIFDVPYTTVNRGSVIVPFLNGSIKIPAGVFRIAKKTDALVVPFFMQNNGLGKLTAHFDAPLSINTHTVNSFMSLLAERLEKRIYQTPGHWWLWEALPLLRA